MYLKYRQYPQIFNEKRNENKHKRNNRGLSIHMISNFFNESFWQSLLTSMLRNPSSREQCNKERLKCTLNRKRCLLSKLFSRLTRFSRLHHIVFESFLKHLKLQTTSPTKTVCLQVSPVMCSVNFNVNNARVLTLASPAGTCLLESKSIYLTNRFLPKSPNTIIQS